MDTATLSIQIVYFVAGLVVLYFGAEWTVKGSSTLATNLGISPIVVGVTIIALGTSAPELVVGIIATLSEGTQDIALGNVIGSNIANIGLIVGVTGLIYPLKVRTSTLKYEVPMFLLTALSLYIMGSMDGVISRVEGGILIGMGIIFNYIFVKKALKDSKAKKSIEANVTATFEKKGAKNDKFSGNVFNGFLAIFGILFLCLGANLMVESASKVAHEYFGMSMVVIGLTIVAIGTSLPELAACIMAACKKQSDIALGNVLGSNIYNIFLIIGVVALISPLPVSPVTAGFDLPIMVILSFVFIVFLVTDRELARWEASLLLLSYVSYLVFLYFRETQSFSLVF